jgi:hypothetical protein
MGSSRIRTTALALSVALAAGAADADPTDEVCPSDLPAPHVPDELLAELIGWIALTTIYDVSDTWRNPPEIAFCAPGDRLAYEERTILVEPSLQAAYDLPARRIHLVLPWWPDDLFDRSVLLHELVHDVQLANRDWDCIGAPEWEAYRLQDQWLQEHGMIHAFDWDAIAALSRCPPDGQD